MAKFQLQAGEHLLRKGSVSYLKARCAPQSWPAPAMCSSFFKPISGTGYLTDRRLVHTSNVLAQAIGGIAEALMGSKVDVDLPLETIDEIWTERHGRKKSVLTAATCDGQEYRFVTRSDEWLPALNEAMSTRRPAPLPERESGR